MNVELLMGFVNAGLSRLERLQPPITTPFRKELMLLYKAKMRANLQAETPAEPPYTLVRSLRLWPLD